MGYQPFELQKVRKTAYRVRPIAMRSVTGRRMIVLMSLNMSISRWVEDIG
jgi:ribosomal protein L34